MAAKHAFLSSQYPRKNHFNIFYSDGVATWPQNVSKDNYIKVESASTTFTIFFTKQDPGFKVSDLEDMTKNIQNNGYSPSNYLSKLLYTESDYEKLLSIIQDTIFTKILDPVTIEQSNNYGSTNKL